eukprot:TRINITY_DN10359_c0_g1_i6.p1 TRINITY_DN10359_c0_g1~~TRINITY_DN10359_c0_g1_i6.p1  ORF type:complete len:308 (-),score=4.51 TRINITY_DN10359_c0_g1_i6:150-1073(-)
MSERPKFFFKAAEWCVVYKPSGWAVHEGTKTNQTISRWLQNVDMRTHAPAHRVDKIASGLLLCAKPRVARFLQADFLDQRVHQEYLALVRGVGPTTPRMIDDPIRKISTPFTRAQVLSKADPALKIIPDVDKPESKDQPLPAQTFIQTIAVSKKHDVSLLLVSPITSRVHQIRAHTAFIGHSLLFDPLYGSSEPLPSLPSASYMPSFLSSQFYLHAWRMALPDPEHIDKRKVYRFEADIPDRFQEILERLEFKDLDAQLEKWRQTPVMADYLQQHGSNRQKKRLLKSESSAPRSDTEVAKIRDEKSQ